MNKASRQLEFRYDVDEKPAFFEELLLSFQHIFAMFGATILVPIILGLPVSVALFASGLATLTYHFITQGKVPVYLGSSFAFVSAMALAIEQMNGDVSASQTGIILTGLVYVIVAFIIKQTGTGWLNYILPPIVIGPMIIVIGLSLAGTAVENASLVSGGNWKEMLVALFTLLVCAYINILGRGFLKVVPFLVAMGAGYILSIILGLVDFTPVLEASWFSLPEFYLPFETPYFESYHFYFGPEAWAILPVAFVTMSEHIGDHTVLSQMTGRDFLQNPGLHRTLLGDGIGTAISAFFGGPANTTYGENTGVIGLTRVASTSVLRQAAVLAIILSCLGKFSALISTIPTAVLGGMSILLYGIIASNGLKVLIENQVDFSDNKNLIIASAMFVLGLGGAVLDLGGNFMLSGTALAAIVGIVLNLILPDKSIFLFKNKNK